MDKKTIFLIPPNSLPIPAVGGGAIETLLTNLLDVNEIEQKCRFVVVSKDSEEARKIKYQHAKIYYFNKTGCVGCDWFWLDLLSFFRPIFIKLFQNRISAKIVGRHWSRDRRALYLQRIAKLEKVDIIVNEGNGGEEYCARLVELVGKEHCFNHIHYARSENRAAREAIPNSISISEFVKSGWAASPDIPGRNEVLYNGIDLGRFQKTYSEKHRRELRKQFGADEDTVLVIFCGRISKEKGVKELLDAFDLLASLPIRLLLIGSVGFSAGTTTKYARRMEQRAKKMENVLTLGYVPNENMPELYSCADIQVIPSIGAEGAGLVAIEGMASGLPLIATASGGMTEYIDDEVAIQLPIDDNLPSNLASAISELAKDRAKREKMSQLGRKRAERFSAENFYANFLKIVLHDDA